MNEGTNESCQDSDLDKDFARSLAIDAVKLGKSDGSSDLSMTRYTRPDVALFRSYPLGQLNESREFCTYIFWSLYVTIDHEILREICSGIKKKK